MYNLLLALAGAVAVFLAFFATGVLGATGAAFLGTIAFAAAYFVLARRTMAQLQALMAAAEAEISAAAPRQPGGKMDEQRVEAGLAKVREGFALGRWQLFVDGQVHGQLGVLLFMLDRPDEALPHLEKAFVRMGQPRLMLGVLHFKAKRGEAMVKAFEESVAAEKKSSLAWATYAWCLHESGLKSKALEALGRGVAELPGDARLKENQLALQNNQRPRMKAFGMEWWALRLEKPSMDDVPAGMRPPPAGFRRGYRQPPKQRS